MIASQSNRELEFISSLGQDVLLLHNFKGKEQLGRLYKFDLELRSTREDIDFESLLGQNISIRLNISRSSERFFNGYITDFSQGESKEGFATYKATVSPWLWFLKKTKDCRIFQSQSVVDIIQSVFSDCGQADFELRLSNDYCVRDYCVQYRESDFNFVSRLMEEEGIYYYFEHDNGEHKLILCDTYSSHQVIPAYTEIPYYPPDATTIRHEDIINLWKNKKRVLPGAVVLNDYDFEQSRANICNDYTYPEEHSQAKSEVYDYPGRYVTLDDGKHYARIRQESLHAKYAVRVGGSTAREFYAGGLMSMVKHPRDDQNSEYLITSVTHEADQDAFGSTKKGGSNFIYKNSFKAIPSLIPFKTKIKHKHPVVEGPQHAMIVGPKNEEIYCDEFGRVKVQFPWDRYGVNDENSSCWVRVSQNWAGGSWGHMAVPRIGQEVIVDFYEGNPDRPVITGRTYNDATKIPYPLPANKTKMTIKSNTHKGTGFNELRFEDEAGKEEVFIHAQKDQNNVVRDSESTLIGNNRSETVQNNESVTVVKGDRRIVVKTGDETKTIEQGNLSEAISKTRSTFANAVSVKAQKGKKGNAPGVITHVADDLIHLKVGSSEIIMTPDIIEIKQGGSAIRIDASVIDQKAGNIHLNKDGGSSGGSGDSADGGIAETDAAGLSSQKDTEDAEPWLRGGLENTDEVKIAHYEIDGHANSEGVLGKFDGKIGAGAVALDHSGHFGDSNFGGSHKLKILDAGAEVSGGIVNGAGIRGKAEAVYKAQEGSVFYGADENNPLAEGLAGYKVGSAEAAGEALLGNDGHYRGVGLSGKVGAAALSGGLGGEVNIPIPFTDMSFRAAGKVGGEVGAVGIGGGAYAKENIKTGRKHVSVSGKVAALLGIKGDVDLSIGPKYTDRKRD